MRPDHEKTYPKTAALQLSKKFNRTFRKDVLAKTQKYENGGSMMDSMDMPNMNEIIHVQNMYDIDIKNASPGGK